MADADKTTATEDLMPLHPDFVDPCTIATKNAYGGWNGKDRPEPGKTPGPGRHISGTADCGRSNT